MTEEAKHTGVADIVESLRSVSPDDYDECCSVMNKAADTIERLRAALEPFAKAARCYDDGVRGGNMPSSGVWHGWMMGNGVTAELTVEDLRCARAALEGR